jgi:hypothetical protein
VDGDHGVGLQQFAEFDAIGSGHRVLERPGDVELNGSQVQHHGPHLDPVGDLAHAVVQDCVAGDPQGAVVLARPPQGEARDLAGDRATQWRTVAARRRGDLQRGQAGLLE